MHNAGRFLPILGFSQQQTPERMTNLNNYPIPEKVLNLLQDQEELEFFEKPRKDAYDRVVKRARIVAVVLATFFTGLFFYHIGQSAGYIKEFFFELLWVLIYVTLFNIVPVVFYIKAQRAKGGDTKGMFNLSSIWAFVRWKPSQENASSIKDKLPMDNHLYQQNRNWCIRLFIVCNVGLLLYLNSAMILHFVRGFLMYNILPIVVYVLALWYQQLHAKSFYAFSNMRLLFGQESNIDYVYYKDIRDLKVEKDILSIDTGDYHNNAIRLRVIRGVKDIDNFVKVINQKLLKDRMP